MEITPEEFIEWLGPEVAAKFIARFDSYNWGSWEETAEEYAEQNGPYLYVISAFCWQSTEEGTYFWEAYHKKWSAYVEEKLHESD